MIPLTQWHEAGSSCITRLGNEHQLAPLTVKLDGILTENLWD